jgi:hypothetical protein
VLWHQLTVHIAGINHSTDKIRMAMIHDFKKTHMSVSDAQLMDFDDRDIWRDWSQDFRDCHVQAEKGNDVDREGEWEPRRPRL